MKKFYLVAIFIFLNVSIFFASQKNEMAELAFTQSCDAFKEGDWSSAMILLRKALSFEENNNPDTWYMLISSEMYASSYEQASRDCDFFIENFPSSYYIPYVQYQKGRTLFLAKEYEKSILHLSDFCHQYGENEMYASALFWMAESFFESYNYAEAKSLYERILNDFPEDSKFPLAQERLKTISERSREEKLLYLLKKTGEAYLSAKEGYEKNLKMYDTVSATSADATKRLSDLQQKNTELENENAYLRSRVAELENYRENERIKLLKQKASILESLLEGAAK
ncbi:MAG: tetratricopeptide repeat protein [Treponema sp.]|nr:tetratricopeptide repeat protein [Treponema sp.]